MQSQKTNMDGMDTYSKNYLIRNSWIWPNSPDRPLFAGVGAESRKMYKNI